MQQETTTDPLLAQLHQIHQYHRTGATASYAFRKNSLLQLKDAVLKHEAKLYQALHTDLKKSTEESWVTEVGFLIAELNHTLKHLRQWMEPERVPTNLLNFPSKSVVYREPLGIVLIYWSMELSLSVAVRAASRRAVRWKLRGAETQ
jgi:aldehyde dehydrogenase (NAD+)